MNGNTKYVVEARDSAGNLKFDCPQPPVRDWDEDDLAAAAWKANPEAELHGQRLLMWMSDHVNEFWQTRVKTW